MTTLDAPVIDKEATPGSTDATPDRWSDSMDELAALDTPEESRAKPPKKAPVEKPVKAVEAKPDKPVEKPAEKPDGDLEDFDDSKPVKASELRTHYDQAKVKLKEREAELIKLKGELEKRSKPVDDPEKKTLSERLEKEEQTRKKYEERLRLVDYRNSDEFQGKFWKPYQDSITRATQDLEDLTFERNGTQHKVDNSTILWLSNMRPAQAEAEAQSLFGDLSRLVTDRIDKVRNAARDMNQAVTEHQKNAEQTYKQQQEQSIEQQRRIGKVWTDERKAWPEKFPNMFAPKDGDDEGNGLLAKGYELVEQAFSPNGKAPEEMAKVHAEIYHKAAAFPRLALNLKRARGRIKELETSLAEYENAEPPAGTGRGTPAPDKSDVMDDAFTELGNLK